MQADAFGAANDPKGQLKHAKAPEELTFPDRQLRQATVPFDTKTLLKVPAGQATHESTPIAPDVLVTAPGRQGMHAILALDPSIGLYVLGGHNAQLDSPGYSLNAPRGHKVQVDAFPSLNDPAGQTRHDSEPVELANVPGGHGVHTDEPGSAEN